MKEGLREERARIMLFLHKCSTLSPGRVGLDLTLWLILWDRDDRHAVVVAAPFCPGLLAHRAQGAADQVPSLEMDVTPLHTMMDVFRRSTALRLAPPLLFGAAIFFLVLLPVDAVAQDGFDVTGTILSADDGTPLPGVNVVEVGTQNGTTTNSDGRFTLTVADSKASLQLSFVGFDTRTVPLRGRSELRLRMQPTTQALNEVVVTALGIEKETKAAGYAISEVDGAEVSDVQETNVVNALAGEIAGVTVSQPASGPTGARRVVIRGVTTFGNNQPLYVVDGIPIDNSNLGSASMWGGEDLGDGLFSLNPSDIKDVSVLKGAAAAALYGNRAQNGVILITTKKGRQGTGLGMSYNSTITFDGALPDFDDIQTQYGQGTTPTGALSGTAPRTVEEALDTGLLSWGEQLDGSQALNFDGQERAYRDHGDAVDNFYETGTTLTNSLSLTRGFENSSFRFSFSNQKNQGIIDESSYNKSNLTLSGQSTRIGEDILPSGWLDVSFKGTYTLEDVQNRSNLSDSPGNPNWVALLPHNVPLDALRPGVTDANAEKQFQSNPFVTNPFFATNQFFNNDERRRILGYARTTYHATDWLEVMGRVGTDFYTLRLADVEPVGTAFNPDGAITENEWRVRENNASLLVSVDERPITSWLSASGSVGGNRRWEESEQLNAFGDGFIVPGVRNVGNTKNQTPNIGIVSRKEVNSVYGTATLNVNDYLFIEGTGRNDWSSALPLDNNSFFYPSVSGSFVFSEAFSMPEWLDFGKVRASYAEVGSDLDPFQLNLRFNVLSTTVNGQPLGNVASNTVPPIGIEPSQKEEVEVGVDLRMFDRRLQIDATYYTNDNTNQILSAGISGASGFGSRIINAGLIENQGVELLLKTIPYRTDDGTAEWGLDLNFAVNENEVAELTEDITQFRLPFGQSRTRDAFVEVVEGREFGTITGTTYERDDQGSIVHENGLPVVGSVEPLGNNAPDWTAGITNRFSYQNFTVKALLDFRIGGEIYSGTNARLTRNGLHEMTLQGREEGITGEGVTRSGAPNDERVSAQSYFGRVADIAEEFVYDASFVKLREVRFGYRLPARWTNAIRAESVSLSAVGRNLWLIHDEVPNVDPESNINSTNAQGLEFFGVPPSRSYGFSLGIQF